MTGNSIKRNYIFSLIYQILNIFIQFITLPYLSRVLGAEGIGVQSYTNSIVTYFAMFGALGVNWYGQSEIARHYGKKEALSTIFYELVILKLLCSLFILPFYFLLILMSPVYGKCYLILLATFFASMIDISWFYQGIEKFDVIAMRNIIIKVAGTITVFALVKSPRDTELYIFIVAMSTFIGNSSMWLQLKKVLVAVNFKDLRIKRHLIKVLHYFIPTIASSLYLMLDKSMIGLITHNEAENGYYEQTGQIVNMIKTVVLSYNAVMVSRMSILFSQKNKNEVEMCIKNSLSFIMGISWPMAVGIAFVAKGFSEWYFGVDFKRIACMLVIFSPIVIFVGISNMLESHIITPLGKRSIGNRIVIMGALVNLILNIILIPHFAAIGAAFSSVFAELLIAIGYQRAAKEYVSWTFIFKCSYKKIISSIVMAISLFVISLIFPEGIELTIIQIVIGGVTYFITLFLLKDNFHFFTK